MDLCQAIFQIQDLGGTNMVMDFIKGNLSAVTVVLSVLVIMGSIMFVDIISGIMR